MADALPPAASDAVASGAAASGAGPASAAPPLPDLGFAYVVLTVRDIGRMRRWYEEVLGFRCVHAGHLAALKTDFAVLEAHGLRLELTAPADSAECAGASLPLAEALGVPGWRVLTLRCGDLAALDGRLRYLGCDVEWYSRRVSASYCATVFRDVEGNVLSAFSG